MRDFGTDYEAALEVFAEIEDEMGERDDLDVVLVGADSLETAKRTHSSYFGDTARTFEVLLPAGVLAHRASPCIASSARPRLGVASHP